MIKKLMIALSILSLCSCVTWQTGLEEDKGPPSMPRPKQVTSAEITAGTESDLRSYAPDDIVSFISTHGGADAYTVKVDAAATAAYLYNAGSGAVRAGTNVTIDDDGNYITINASLAGGAVDTEGTLNADEIAVMHDLDTIKSLTEAEFKAAYNMEAGTDYLAPAGDGGLLTNLDGNNIQDDTIDDDSLDFSDITLDDFVSAENDYISVASDDTFDFTREDSGSVVITASDDDANAALIIRGGGTGSLTLGGASNTSIMVLTDGGSMVLDGYISIGSNPADAGTIRLENATALAWEDATEATITHVDDTGFIINLALEVDGALNADGAVSLGDGGDNFSVASDGIDIDTSGNVSNAGTIACGKVTSSAAFESATGLFDVTGAAAITVGSADVTAITLQTDDTGDGTDLVLPAQSVNGSEILNNTVTATQISATVTLADGDVFDFSGITHTGLTDEGLALPTWANVTPTSDKAWISWDGTNQILKVYDGGWVSISPSGAPTDATYLTLSVDATLSDERVLTESTQGIDFTDGGAGSTLTISLDTTEVDATTWSDGANSSNTWIFDLDTTDFNMVASNGLMTFSDAVTVTDTLTANNGIDLGTSNSITGTTGLTIGGGTETVAINSSDWDIDATGTMTGIGTITSDGIVTATGFTIGSAAITETELEIIDGATLGTSDINIIDGISDSGTLTATELLYVDGVTSAIQTQLDARCLESVFGDSIEADDLELSGTTLQLATEIPHIDAATNISADWETQDDTAESIGNDNDWERTYDETTDDRLEYTHTAGAGADVYWDLNDNAADSTYTITNSDGTYDANLEIDGDLYLQNGSIIRIDSTTVDHKMSFYAYDTDGTVWTEVLSIVNGTDPGITMGNLHLADSDTSPDSSGELVYDNTVTGLDNGALAIYVDSAINYIAMYETLPVNDGYQLTYNASTDLLYWAAAGGAGSTAWDDITNPDNGAVKTITFDNSEYTVFTSDFDGGDVIVIQISDTDQAADTTGLKVQSADTDDDNTIYIEAVADYDGTPDVVWELSGDGNVVQDGSITTGGNLATGGASLSSGDVYHRLGDASGSDVFVIEDSGGTDQLTVDSDGEVTALGLLVTGVGIDGIGAVDIDVGSSDITDVTIITDGTGDGEIVLPDDSIGPAEMAPGAYDLGTSVEADTITQAGDAVLVASTNQDISSNKEFQDNNTLGFGDDQDWRIYYDETIDDRLEIFHTDTAVAGNSDIYVDMDNSASDSDFEIANSDGTYKANLLIEGNITGLTKAVSIGNCEGAHDGAENASTLSDSGESLTVDAYIGMTVYNITDGSSGTVTDNDGTTITATLSGGTDNDWDSGDVWQVGPGPNQSGSVFYVSTATTIAHPATAGYVAGYFASAAQIIKIDPYSASMTINFSDDGTFTDPGAGDEIDGDGTQGDFIWIHNASTTEAYSHGVNGSWADGGAS